MGLILQRTVSRISDEGSTGRSEPLAAYRDTRAFVLLGDPGAGKTTAFEKESSLVGENAEFVTARDFLTLDSAQRPAWRTSILFIDGLDEVRAGQADARTPFDAIRARLDQLRPPHFRISCREADWFGENDRQKLQRVSPDGQIAVLRLDPLGDEEVQRLVSSLAGDRDPQLFLGQADERRIKGLLRNPQNLDLFAKVFRETGGLPSSRLETFEQAMPLLAQEANEEHGIGRLTVHLKSIVEAAGWLSAIQLLSGKASHCLGDHDTTGDSIPVSLHGADRRHEVEAALKTRLFTAEEGRQSLMPAHANLAAFLAARTLARQVRDGLPQGRVLSLLAGDDGAPPSSLGSLVAWLAALSPELRSELIARDPVAVLMYGDIHKFTPPEKTLVLDEMERDPSRLHGGPWPLSALVGLASDDMESALRSVLRDRDRGESKQKVVEVVAEALAVTPLGRRLSGLLADVVRDETRSPAVRRRTLDAWIRALADKPGRAERYRELLTQVRYAPAGDPRGELTATLLRVLYPDSLGPGEIWDFFSTSPGFSQQLASEFWQELSRTCPDGHLAGHLDRLADSIEVLRPELRERLLHEVPLRLLARTLENCGDEIDPSRLFRWLSVGLDESGHLMDPGSEAKALIARVQQWLEKRPDLQKEVIRVALRSDGFRPRGRISTAIRELLYRSEPPDEIGAWHLDQAVLVVSTDRRLMEFHIRAFLENLVRQPIRVDEELARARQRLATNPEAIRHLESGLKSELPDDHLDDAEAYRRARAPDATLLRAVRRSRRPLRENRANPALLHELARLYHAGAFIEGETTDRERLLKALSGDEELTDAAIAGIRGAPDREDLPSLERVLRLRSRRELDWLTLPVLVGLTERSLGDVLSFDRDRLATMLALRLARQDSSEDPAWYRECLRQQPSLVAEILLRFGRVALAAGEKHLPDLYRLSREPSYAEVAKRVTMPLLRAFPVRARADQHELLTDLLQSALVRCNRTKLRKLIERKAGLGSVTRTQRLYWLAAGLALEPNRFGSLLSESGEPYVRSQVLERMFPFPGTSVHEVPGLAEKLEPGATEFLIRQLGALRNPLRHEAGVSVGWGWTNSMGVEDHIMRLGRSSDKSAAEALQRLADEPSLPRWKRHLEHALETQRVIRQDAKHTPPTPREVIAALNNGPPASAADLRELALDRLRRIAREVRCTNADLWQFFWNQDSHGKLTEPKPENPCRDALLEILSRRLPDGCDVQREGQYAGNRRADLRIVSGKRNIPVEIKKNTHSDLWGAVRNQLLPRYTNDPATEGLGIYLVLWFGPQRTTPAPDGPRPQTADDLRDRLLANLTSEERRRAAVIVMDVTPP